MATGYQIINVPGHGALRFPDDMSDEEIGAALATLSDGGSPDPDVPTIDRNGRPVLPAATPKERPGIGEALLGGLETVTSLATGATTGLLGSARGLGAIAANVVHGVHGTDEAAQRASEQAALGVESLTYAPRTEAGQRQLQRLGPALENLTAIAPNLAAVPVPRPPSRGALRALASDKAEAAAGRNQTAQANQRIDAISQETIARRQRQAELDTARTARNAPLTEARKDVLARGWAQRNGLDFDQLHPDIQGELRSGVAHPQGLEGVTPQAVMRHNQILARTGVQPTRAQVEPTVEALAQEKAAASIPEAADLRSVRPAQDEAVAADVDRIRRSFGVAETGREQLGTVIQNTGLRRLADASQRRASSAYARAAELAPDYEVPIDRIVDLRDVNNQPLARNLQFLNTWLNRGHVEQVTPGRPADPFGRRPIGQRPEATPPVVTNRPVTLRELNDLRVKANRQMSRGGPEAHGARQVVQAIDETMAEIAVNESRAGTNTTPAVGDAIAAWQEATAGWRSHMQRWSDPQSMRALTGESRRTFGRSDPDSPTNPRVAMERTIDSVVGNRISTEGLRTVYARLNEGTTPLERSVGAYTQNAIRAGVVDHLNVILRRGAEGTAESARNYNLRGFVDAFQKLEDDGKISVVFDERQAAELRALVRDARLLDEAPVGYAPRQQTPQQIAAQIKANTPRVEVGPISAMEPAAPVGVDPSTSANLGVLAGQELATHALKVTGLPYIMRHAGVRMLASRYKAFRDKASSEARAAQLYADTVSREAAKEARAARKAALESERESTIQERTAASTARRITAAREPTLSERARQQQAREGRAAANLPERIARRESRRNAFQTLQEARIAEQVDQSRSGREQFERAVNNARGRRIPGKSDLSAAALLRQRQEQNQQDQ